MIQIALLLASAAGRDHLLRWLREDLELRGLLQARPGTSDEPAAISVDMDSPRAARALAQTLMTWMITRGDPDGLTVTTAGGQEIRLDPGSAVMDIERLSGVLTAAGDSGARPITPEPSPPWQRPTRSGSGPPPPWQEPTGAEPSPPWQRPIGIEQPLQRWTIRAVPPRSPHQSVARGAVPPASPIPRPQPARLPDPGGSTAILVGVSTYTDPALADLPAVRNSVDRLADALTTPLNGGFATGQSRVLHNPGRQEALDAIAEASRTATDTVLVYFAGHAIVDTDGETHLALADTDPARPASSALSLEILRRTLEGSGAPHRLVILDCAIPGRPASGAVAQLFGPYAVDQGVLLAAATPARESAAVSDWAHTALVAEVLDAARTQRPMTTLDDLHRRLPAELTYLQSRDLSRVAIIGSRVVADSRPEPPVHGPVYGAPYGNAASPPWIIPLPPEIAEAPRRLRGAWRATVAAIRDVLDLSPPSRAHAHVTAGLAVDRSWAALEDQLDQLTRQIGPPFDADDERSRGPRD